LQEILDLKVKSFQMLVQELR